MQLTMIRYGVLAAIILSGLMVANVVFFNETEIDLGTSQVIGYASMVLAFLMVFFGIRSYRDNVRDGSIGFGKAFQVGIVITLIACAGYVISWEILYFNYASDFLEKYTAQVIEGMREDGATEEEIAKTESDMAEFAELYANPVVNVGLTFLEVFPIGLVMTLVSAGILRRRVADGGAATATG